MIVMASETNMNLTDIKHLNILGIGLVSLSLENIKEKVDILLHKGISFSLIQNIIELYKIEIFEKLNGKSFFPLEEFMVFINYFQADSERLIVLIYIDDKESAHIYPKLYMHSKKVMNYYNIDHDINGIMEICKNTIEIPRIDGTIGLFIVDYGGCPLYTKVMGMRPDIKEGEVQIGGFISALFSFSQFVIGKESGGKLREINFGNQTFYTITEKKCIIAYLIERMTPLLKRYMYILAEEFINTFSNAFKDHFDGNIAQFEIFEDTVNEYLII